MSFTAHHRHECSSQVVIGARHRGTCAWYGTAATAAMATAPAAMWTTANTKRQRLKEPSPG
jgi:hypothetical protein